MPTVVQFGAGAIGRGFLGQLWSEAGYEVVFVDVDAGLVERLNRAGSYPLRLVRTDAPEEVRVGPVRAVHAGDVPAVLREVAGCAFAATAVGPGLEGVARGILAPSLTARGTLRRAEPLNVLCCENDYLAYMWLDRVLDQALLPLSDATRARHCKRIRFVQAVVGRMVPVPNPQPDDDPLLVSAEPYKELPVQGRWLVGMPEVPGMHVAEPFDNYLRRKMYAHNGGHAVLAYQGYLRGHEYVWQCAEDPEVAAELHGFWAEANAYLGHYRMDEGELWRHEADLLDRFRNRALGDTVARVGRDPARKLGAGERLVSLANRCLFTGVADPVYTVRAIAAALLFNQTGDPSAADVRAKVAELGVRRAFLEVAGVPAEDPRGLAPRVEEAYNSLASRTG